MERYRLPDTESVHALLDCLLTQGVEVKEAAGPINADTLAMSAVYANEDGAIGALCLCDLAAANYTGAALSMIPPGVAGDNVDAGVVEGVILENLHEVFNICVNLFNDPSLPTLFLRGLVGPGQDMPEDVQSARSSPSSRLDLQLDVGRYGTGQMSLFVP